jgi:hypothetical protein
MQKANSSDMQVSPRGGTIKLCFTVQRSKKHENGVGEFSTGRVV